MLHVVESEVWRLERTYEYTTTPSCPREQHVQKSRPSGHHSSRQGESCCTFPTVHITLDHLHAHSLQQLGPEFRLLTHYKARFAKGVPVSPCPRAFSHFRHSLALSFHVHLRWHTKHDKPVLCRTCPSWSTSQCPGTSTSVEECSYE